ncbi:hypothetical protein BKA70DRAFT_1297012 [Coprinopsis sp. MPI-PUGE-AT-0042]|nr:hypothetical protein BKA70DRAFT_1297012 [Coprinopsis sp. MPI-PUGE-AT-0042]
MITLFDIASGHTPNKTWSPNTWKTRFCLNYKGLPYQTEWVEFAEIEAVYHKHNIPPCAKPDGTPGPHYSLPAIFDVNPTTGKATAIADSLKIARYLDNTYPDTPKVLPSEDDEAGLQRHKAFASKALLSDLPLFPNIVPVNARFGSLESQKKLDEVGAGALRKLFKSKYEHITSLSDVHLSDEERKENIAKHKESLTAVGAAVQDEDGREGGKVTWCFGEAISFADFALAGALMWIKAVLGEESDEWKAVLELSEGKWSRFMRRLKLYQVVL